MSERKFVTYSKEFKEMAAKLYLEGGKSYKTLIEEHIRFYNTEWFQKRLGQLSPVEYREKLAA